MKITVKERSRLSTITFQAFFVWEFQRSFGEQERGAQLIKFAPITSTNIHLWYIFSLAGWQSCSTPWSWWTRVWRISWLFWWTSRHWGGHISGERNINNTTSCWCQCQTLKGKGYQFSPTVMNVSTMFKGVNESDPRSNVHYLGSSENKAWTKIQA